MNNISTNLRYVNMGIKPSYIKSTGAELITRFGDKMSNNFDENKQVVTDMKTAAQQRRAEMVNELADLRSTKK